VSLGGQHLGQTGGSQKPPQPAMSYAPNSFAGHVLVSSPQGPSPVSLHPQVGVGGHFGHFINGSSAHKQSSSVGKSASGQSTGGSSPQNPFSLLHLHSGGLGSLDAPC